MKLKIVGIIAIMAMVISFGYAMATQMGSKIVSPSLKAENVLLNDNVKQNFLVEGENLSTKIELSTKEA